MPLMRFLRRVCGLSPPRASVVEIEQAEHENMVRAAEKNLEAHAEMKRVFDEDVPRSSGRLRDSIQKSVVPFADFEDMMHQLPRRRRRNDEIGGGGG